MKVSFYSSVMEKQNCSEQLTSILKKVKNGEWEGPISQIRKELSNGMTVKADELKRKLPAFTSSATFNGSRKESELDEYNGIIGLDYDKVDDAEKLKSNIEQQPYTYSAFISPSGNGVKAFVKTDSSLDNHTDAFNAVRERYDSILGIESDKSVKDVSRCCFVSYDPELYLNDNCEIFTTTSSRDLTQLWEYTSNKIQFIEGSRNNFMFNFACNANREGIDINNLINFGVQKAVGDFGSEEIERTIRSAYDNNHHENSKDSRPAIPAKSQEELPYIPESVYENLPDTLKVACTHFEDRSRDVFLTSALSVISGGLHNMYGLYDNDKVYANLYSLVIAPPASGKGSMKYSKILGDCYHSYLLDRTREEITRYKKEKKIYDIKLRKAKINEIDSLKEPLEPKLNIFFLPADSSSAAMAYNLQSNEGKGCICETEADTLSSTLKQDWGGYSDVLRKGYHGEDIESSRKTNFEYTRIKDPKFSMALTGTPNQLPNLITSAEDGLFSRCLLYSFKSKPKWKNTYTEAITKSKTEYFLDYSAYLCDKFKSNTIQKFSMTPEQGKILNERFSSLLIHNTTLFNDDVASLVYRHGLMTYKISMVLGGLRSDDEFIVCRDDDFNTAITLVETYLKHAIYLLNQINGTKYQYNEKETNLLNWIEDHKEFKRCDIGNFANTIDIPERTLSDILKKFIQKKRLVKIKSGFYKKA